MRGDEPAPSLPFRPPLYVFPACAGMSLREEDPETGEVSFPRMRGDEPFGVSCPLLLAWFSPHARG